MRPTTTSGGNPISLNDCTLAMLVNFAPYSFDQALRSEPLPYSTPPPLTGVQQFPNLTGDSRIPDSAEQGFADYTTFVPCWGQGPWTRQGTATSSVAVPACDKLEDCSRPCKLLVCSSFLSIDVALPPRGLHALYTSTTCLCSCSAPMRVCVPTCHFTVHRCEVLGTCACRVSKSACRLCNCRQAYMQRA